MPLASSGFSTSLLLGLVVAWLVCIAIYVYYGFYADSEERDKWRLIVMAVPIIAAVVAFALGYDVALKQRDAAVDQATHMIRRDIVAEAGEIERRARALSRFADKDFQRQDRTKFAVELLTLENLARRLREQSD